MHSHNLFHVMTVFKCLTNLAYDNFIKLSATSPVTGSSVLKWELDSVQFREAAAVTTNSK